MPELAKKKREEGECPVRASCSICCPAGDEEAGRVEVPWGWVYLPPPGKKKGEKKKKKKKEKKERQKEEKEEEEKKPREGEHAARVAR